MTFPDFCIVQFTRSPDSPSIKTRMSPALDAGERIRLHQAMTRHICETAARADLCPVRLWVDGDPDHPFLAALSREFGLECHGQAGEDLGARLYNAARTILADFGGVIFVGSDCPFIGPAYLKQAMLTLQREDAVVGPAGDGGYVLLGLRKLSPALFDNMPWGSPQVLAATTARLNELAWSYGLLPSLPDMDRPEDLDLLTDPGLPAVFRQFSR